MSSSRRSPWALLPTAGLVAATAATGWATSAQSSPAPGPADPDSARALAGEGEDGTYESCAAYFGFGKQSDRVLDVVDFDVVDINGSDQVEHAVEADTPVVLVLTNADGDTLECEAFEVGEQQWNDAMDEVGYHLPSGSALPAWPGPGHYAYPSLSFGPQIEGFGPVVDVGFRVTGVPEGHTLVAPTEVRQLVQHHMTDVWQETLAEVDPRVLDLIAGGAGAEAAGAFEDALARCEDGADQVEVTEALAAAIEAITSRLLIDSFEPDAEIGCWTLTLLNAQASVVLAVEATTTYTETIQLALPEVAETTTSTPDPSTTTTAPAISPNTAAPGATPVVASPTYTG